MEKIKLTDDEVRKICEENGIQFVSRSFGLTTTKTIALHDLVVIINKCIESKQS